MNASPRAISGRVESEHMQPLQIDTVTILTGTAIIFVVSMFAGGIGNYPGSVSRPTRSRRSSTH